MGPQSSSVRQYGAGRWVGSMRAFMRIGIEMAIQHTQRTICARISHKKLDINILYRVHIRGDAIYELLLNRTPHACKNAVCVLPHQRRRGR